MQAALAAASPSASPSASSSQHADSAIHGLAELAAAAAASSLPSQHTQRAHTSPLAALADGETPTKRGSNLACLKCRAIKVRCSRAKPTDQRCKRCNRLDLVCEYKQHHRGRKPSKRPRITHPKQQPAAHDDDAHDDDHGPRHPGVARSSAPQDAQAPHRLRHGTTHSLSHHARSPDAQSRSDKDDPAPDPSDPIHGRFIGPYLSTILNPASANTKAHHATASPSLGGPRRDPSPPLSSTHPSAASTTTAASHSATAAAVAVADMCDDAVAQRVITLRDARDLFAFFFAELNPPLALFDPNLHTVDYCRRHRPLVFSVVVATSSRFFRPDLHPRCQQISKSAMGLAAADEVCSLDHIQALVVIVTWKGSTDRTIDRKFRRAVGYAYELGLLFSFDEYRTATCTGRATTPSPPAAFHGSSDCAAQPDAGSSLETSPIQRRREERDRQRTWIMLCLVQAVLNKGDRDQRPFPLQVPLRHHPDTVTWYHAGRDLTLPIDARLAWSLEIVALFVEVENIVELTTQNPNPTSFGVLFNTFRQRADSIRTRWFKLTNGRYRARYPMDESAVAELPYLDTHRQMFLSETHWHWSCKVAAFNEQTLRANPSARVASVEFLAQPGVCFARTAGLALDTLQLFVNNIIKPGYLRVGHDYLVICASQAAKWLFLYRDSLDAVTLLSAHATLLEIVKECSRPQYLPSGEPTNIEREAPGYLARYVEALIEDGLSGAVQKVAAHRGSKASSADLAAQGEKGERRSFKSGSAGPAPPKPSANYEATYAPSSLSQHPPLAPPLSSFHDRNATRFAAADNARADSSGRGGHLPATASPPVMTPYDRSHRQPTSQLSVVYGYGEVNSAIIASPIASSPSTSSSLNAANSHSAHLSNQPAYPALNPLADARSLSSTLDKSSQWPVYDGSAGSVPVDPGTNLNQQMSSFAAAPPFPPQSPYPDRQFVTRGPLQQPMGGGGSGPPPPPSLMPTGLSQNYAMPQASAVAPLPADKASLGSLVSLNAQDLSYWESILGSDLSSFS